jgi:hypothetical protein
MKFGRQSLYAILACIAKKYSSKQPSSLSLATAAPTNLRQQLAITCKRHIYI